ncbi:4-hydroxythreonine-4-phosphate dehydrogenase PdxA [Cytophagales bacterium LB-30]|uniref:4-hydroxythreonine-4-phosphate dehydrogenase PdxA n=1 Tax=Shiella aurantiaca TaxID=3058365 RepID=A0ABT8F402_9BACT|nr:4-hydroxythreonine-4-phosphate dehydrogenase PdxA [Shiella aurantiaca]MDN4164951.1 4-hydroxythreonine-4-phosphate dehydrogenase PdxA [Shiella aurantiaca]
MSIERKNTSEKPVIGITMGDINGIGPEVIIKALSDNRMLRFMTPVIYGSSRVLTYYRKAMAMEEQNHHQVKAPGQVHDKKINIFNCWEDTPDIQPGIENETGGKYALLALQKAADDLKNGYLDAVVTAPISKNNIQSEEFKFPGHTEFFTQLFQAKDSLMFLVSDTLRVGVVTGHIPLKEVAGQLSKEKIVKKIKLMEQSLKKDFGINKPRIAVLGLNPHAGENGLLGDEENLIIKPAIDECKNKGMIVTGPFPADGFFGKGSFKTYDGVLAMYHDQGLIPFKTMAFENGINFTAGLEGVRTSPDHGTAFSIAGKNQADESSIREAIYLACEIVRNRGMLPEQ